MLTAAHCLTETSSRGNIIVLAGKHNLNLDEGGQQRVTIERTRWLIHPGWTSGRNSGPNDIALVNYSQNRNVYWRNKNQYFYNFRLFYHLRWFSITVFDQFVCLNQTAIQVDQQRLQVFYKHRFNYKRFLETVSRMGRKQQRYRKWSSQYSTESDVLNNYKWGLCWRYQLGESRWVDCWQSKVLYWTADGRWKFSCFDVYTLTNFTFFNLWRFFHVWR